MATCLDPIRDNFQTARNAAKVVQRCVRVAGIDRERAFRNTAFHRQPDQACEDLLTAARRELSDAIVLALYAGSSAACGNTWPSRRTCSDERPCPTRRTALGWRPSTNNSATPRGWTR